MDPDKCKGQKPLQELLSTPSLSHDSWCWRGAGRRGTKKQYPILHYWCSEGFKSLAVCFCACRCLWFDLCSCISRWKKNSRIWQNRRIRSEWFQRFPKGSEGFCRKAKGCWQVQVPECFRNFQNVSFRFLNLHTQIHAMWSWAGTWSGCWGAAGATHRGGHMGTEFLSTVHRCCMDDSGFRHVVHTGEITASIW